MCNLGHSASLLYHIKQLFWKSHLRKLSGLSKYVFLMEVGGVINKQVRVVWWEGRAWALIKFGLFSWYTSLVQYPTPIIAFNLFFLLGCSGSTDIHSPERLLRLRRRGVVTHLRSNSAKRESLTEKSERKFFDSMTHPKSAIMII